MEIDKKISVILAAAGNSSRLGLNVSKQFLLLNKKSLIQYSLEKFAKLDNVCEIIVVTCNIDATKSYLSGLMSQVSNIKIVQGGKRRQDSIYNGFCKVDPLCDLVLIHDVARPLFDISIVKKCIEIALQSGVCVLACPVVDTLKRAICYEDEFVVNETVNRENLFLIQTPQVFKYSLLQEVYKKYRHDSGFSKEYTDEAMLVESLGKPVNLVPSSKKNIKITYLEDLEIAEAIIKESKEATHA